MRKRCQHFTAKCPFSYKEDLLKIWVKPLPIKDAKAHFRLTCCSRMSLLKAAQYSFSVPIPPKFEHKLRRHKQSFGKIATTVVLVKDENLL